MNFVLTPSSGYPDSYFDCQFLLEFDKRDSVRLRLINETTGETLKVLAVNTGMIENETDILAAKTSKIQGFFNLFNDDKMNLGLQSREYVTVKAVLESDGQSTEAKVNFYNESNSLDAGILPFDIACKNPVIDTKNLTPLTFTMTCNSEKKIEFCLRRENNSAPMWHFEVMARKGQTVVHIPAEILFTELKANTYSEPFKLYYVKFEGFDYKGFLNRKYIPVHGILIRFASKELAFRKRSRIGPDGTPLSDEFMVGDYSVLTHKDFSIAKKDDPEKLRNMSQYFYEALDMRSQAVMHTMATDKPKNEIRQSLQSSALKRSVISVPQLSKPYLTPFTTPPTKTSGLAVPPAKPCGGCSRKKNINA